mmetsp:Transcript_38362/g.89193  ORF Transcript_38362/g.89193 Transcript_38362/m.89193 type:complete len:158 (-) Transcript_38362:416-889(-)
MIRRIVGEGLRGSFRKVWWGVRGRPTVLVDVPLLYESGKVMKYLFGCVILVACGLNDISDCDEEKDNRKSEQFKRLRKRDPDLTEEQCLGRIKAQIPISRKAQMADVVIMNNGSLKDLEENIDNVWKAIIKTRGYLGSEYILFSVYMLVYWTHCYNK